MRKKERNRNEKFFALVKKKRKKKRKGEEKISKLQKRKTRIFVWFPPLFPFFLSLSFNSRVGQFCLFYFDARQKKDPNPSINTSTTISHLETWFFFLVSNRVDEFCYFSLRWKKYLCFFKCLENQEGWIDAITWFIFRFHICKTFASFRGQLFSIDCRIFS